MIRMSGEGRRVGGPAGARPEHHAQLRHPAGEQDVAAEDLPVPVQSGHTFLNPRPAGVDQADDGRPDPFRVVEHAHDLARVHFPERPAEHGSVLREQAHRTAADVGIPGDHPITCRPLAVHAERGGPVPDLTAELAERARVNQRANPPPRLGRRIGRHYAGVRDKLSHQALPSDCSTSLFAGPGGRRSVLSRAAGWVL